MDVAKTNVTAVEGFADSAPDNDAVVSLLELHRPEWIRSAGSINNQRIRGQFRRRKARREHQGDNNS